MHQSHIELENITWEQIREFSELLRVIFPSQSKKIGQLLVACQEDNLSEKETWVELWLAISDWIHYGN